MVIDDDDSDFPPQPVEGFEQLLYFGWSEALKASSGPSGRGAETVDVINRHLAPRGIGLQPEGCRESIGRAVSKTFC
jgi:hypothetical protein